MSTNERSLAEETVELAGSTDPVNDPEFLADVAKAVDEAETVEMGVKAKVGNVADEASLIEPGTPKMKVTEQVYPTHVSTRVGLSLTLPIVLPHGKDGWIKGYAEVELSGTKKVVNEFVFSQLVRDLHKTFEVGKGFAMEIFEELNGKKKD